MEDFVFDVLVFGSNLAGKHGKGAAKDAWQFYGAIPSRGEGIQGLGVCGSSYAIPTKDGQLKVLSLDRIAEGVSRFLIFVATHPGMNFLVSRVGCGLAGYTDAEIAPMFKGAPTNCSFDPLWSEYGYKIWTTPPRSSDAVCF